MALTLRSRLVRAEASRRTRQIDIACQFWAVDAMPDGRVVWSSDASPIYGGRWDPIEGRYVARAERVLHLPCSRAQLAYVTSESSIVEFSGGRGAGKSYAGLLVAIKHVCAQPWVQGRVVSPTMQLARVQWDKIVPQMQATGWLLEERGVHEGDHELWFVNGARIQFRSAHLPHRLASWGGGWAVVDESQDVSDRAVEKLMFCLREAQGGAWQLYHQMTPAGGAALARHDAHVAMMRDDPRRAYVVHADSRANPFSDHGVFDEAARSMDRQRYRIEVLGDWEAVRELEESERLRPVFPDLATAWPSIEAGSPSVYVWSDADGERMRDVTGDVVAARFGAAHRAKKWIVGVDPGTAVPNSATVWRVLARDDGRWVWVAWDYIEAHGHCGHLARMLAADGYEPAQTVIIPDYTAWGRAYGIRSPSGSGVARKGLGPAAARMMQAEGYLVGGESRVNPRVVASVQDMLEKISPASGAPRIRFRLPHTAALLENMATVVWDRSGKDFDRSVPNDPTDSARYPISYFEPAARARSAPVRLYIAREHA